MHLNIIINQGPDGIDNTALATISLLSVLVAVVVLFRRRIQISLERVDKAIGVFARRSGAEESSEIDIRPGNAPESDGNEQSGNGD